MLLALPAENPGFPSGCHAGVEELRSNQPCYMDTMLYTFPELIALLIVICGIVLQTWFGIGFGLVAAPLLFLINPYYVPGPILILGYQLVSFSRIAVDADE